MLSISIVWTLHIVKSIVSDVSKGCLDTWVTSGILTAVSHTDLVCANMEQKLTEFRARRMADRANKRDIFYRPLSQVTKIEDTDTDTDTDTTAESPKSQEQLENRTSNISQGHVRHHMLNNPNVAPNVNVFKMLINYELECKEQRWC